MIKLKIDITTKKGTTVTTTWGIQQARIYPDLECHGTRISWRNTGGLFPQYPATKADGLPAEYYAYLLRDDIQTPTHNNRNDFAGYDGNPGTFALRGVDLGEVNATIKVSPWASCLWEVRGSDRPTTGERDFLNLHVLPHLNAAILREAKTLKAEAVDAIAASVVQRLKEAQASLDECEKQMIAAVRAL